MARDLYISEEVESDLDDIWDYIAKATLSRPTAFSNSSTANASVSPSLME